MVREVIYTTISPVRLAGYLEQIPGMIAGEIPDPLGMAHGFAMRVAVAWLVKVKEAYIVKAGGGVDECGISWPGLTQAYLAYGRGPFSTRRAGKNAPGKVKGGPRDGQQKDGFMTKKQLAEWHRIYRRNLGWLARRHTLAEAKVSAAKIAWATMKRAGVQTKWVVFGTRQVEILRDRGTLFNSLAPGIITEVGADAVYAPPDAQVVAFFPGGVTVGSNVEYAKYHQGGTRTDHSQKGRGAIRRQLWPEPAQVPASWREYLTRIASGGVVVAIRIIAAGGLGR